jgi:hypothetical protein
MLRMNNVIKLNKIIMGIKFDQIKEKKAKNEIKKILTNQMKEKKHDYTFISNIIMEYEKDVLQNNKLICVRKCLTDDLERYKNQIINMNDNTTTFLLYVKTEGKRYSRLYKRCKLCYQRCKSDTSLYEWDAGVIDQNGNLNYSCRDYRLKYDTEYYHTYKYSKIQSGIESQIFESESDDSEDDEWYTSDYTREDEAAYDQYCGDLMDQYCDNLGEENPYEENDSGDEYTEEEFNDEINDNFNIH